jgi:hypothetical protein
MLKRKKENEKTHDVHRPLKRTMAIHKPSRQRAGVRNDVVLLHSRKMNSIKHKKRNVEALKADIVKRMALWEECKAVYSETLKRKKLMKKENATVATMKPVLIELRSLFKHLQDERGLLIKLQLEAKLLENGEFQNEYLLDAIPYLNVHHAIMSDILAARTTDEANEGHMQSLMDDLRVNTHEYTSRFFPGLVRDFDKHNSDIQNNPDVCAVVDADGQVCGGTVTEVSNSLCVCESCGVVAQEGFSVRDPSNNLNWEQLRDAPGRQYTYRRLNHFREFLRQIQGKSRATIPPELYDDLLEEFRICRIPIPKINPARVKVKLKKIGKSRFYEHKEAIASKLNPAYSPIQIDPTHEEKLCLMFVQLESPFESIKHLVKKDRKNMMSYPFAYFKLNELNGWDEYNENCSLLKSVQLINTQDRYWELVMQKLGWQVVGRTFDIHRRTG